MNNKYSDYLDRAGIDLEDTITPILFQLDSSYYNTEELGEWYFKIPKNTIYLYTPITFPTEIFLREVLTGYPNKVENVDFSMISEDVENGIYSTDIKLSEDFKFIIIGNVIHIENVDYDRYIKITGSYVKKTYNNLLEGMKESLRELVYGLNILEPNAIYYAIQGISKFKADTLSEMKPKRIRVSGNSIKMRRRILR